MSDEKRMPGAPAGGGLGDVTPRPAGDLAAAPTRPAAPTEPSAPSIGTAASDPSVEESPVPSARMPGRLDPTFQQLPTGPIPGIESHPDAVPVLWEPVRPPMPRGIAPWALGFAVVGLLASFFVGWGFPIAIVAIVMAILALRRPFERRGLAGWALAFGIIGLVYSGGWLAWAALQLGWFG